MTTNERKEQPTSLIEEIVEEFNSKSGAFMMPSKISASDWLAKTLTSFKEKVEEERDKEILAMLTIMPQDLKMWTKMCADTAREVHLAHPDYVPLGEMRLMSYVKRLLPRIRTLLTPPITKREEE